MNLEESILILEELNLLPGVIEVQLQLLTLPSRLQQLLSHGVQVRILAMDGNDDDDDDNVDDDDDDDVVDDDDDDGDDCDGNDQLQ